MGLGSATVDGSLNAWIEGLRLSAKERSQKARRPLVTLSYAQSLDGSLTTERGKPLALSGPDAMRLTHQLRAAHSALLVGIGTLLADDPRLTVRLAPGESPQPVVLDSGLRTPLAARLLAREDRKPWIFCVQDAPPDRQAALVERGAEIICVPRAAGGGLDLTVVLSVLFMRGIHLLMVEGGARVITAFLAARLADQAVITLAPLWVGGLPVVERPVGVDGSFPRLAEPHYSRYGPDLVVWGSLSMEGREG